MVRTNINFVSTLRCILYKCFWNCSTVFLCLPQKCLIWVWLISDQITPHDSQQVTEVSQVMIGTHLRKVINFLLFTVKGLFAYFLAQIWRSKGTNLTIQRRRNLPVWSFGDQHFIWDICRSLLSKTFLHLLIHLKCQSFQLNLNRKFRMYHLWFWLNMQFRFFC